MYIDCLDLKGEKNESGGIFSFKTDLVKKRWYFVRNCKNTRTENDFYENFASFFILRVDFFLFVFFFLGIFENFVT